MGSQLKPNCKSKYYFAGFPRMITPLPMSRSAPLSQLSRTRESFSDKFGHKNCVILRESALRQF